MICAARQGQTTLQQKQLCRMHNAARSRHTDNRAYCGGVMLNTVLLHDAGQSSPKVQSIDADVQGNYGTGKRH